MTPHSLFRCLWPILLLALLVSACDDESPSADEDTENTNGGDPSDGDGGSGGDVLSEPLYDRALVAELGLEDLDEELLPIAFSVCEQRVECGEIRALEDCADISDAVPDSLRRMVDLIDSGDATVDEDALETCLEALSKCDLSPAEEVALEESCALAVVGSKELGADCIIDSECASNYCFEEDCEDECCEGTCEEHPHDNTWGEPGDPCDSETPCNSEGYCREGTCAKVIAEGEVCDEPNACAAGLYCSFDQLQIGRLPPAPPTCRPLPDEGDDCLAPVEAPPTCGHGLYCDFELFTCTPVGEVGDDCEPRRFGSTCLPSLYCDGESDTCQELPAAGESCDETERCYLDSYCAFDPEEETLECVTLKDNGDECDDEDECKSGYCDKETETCAKGPNTLACEGIFEEPLD